MEEPEDNRKKLYEEFRKQLKSDASDLYYDEDDLIDIYDQAADMEDEYVKLQVLMLAYRLYPRSEEMAARRGFFFWSYNMDEGVEQMLGSSMASDRLIWKLLKLRSRSVTPTDLETQLESLLKDETDIDDETMIQLVDLASEAGSFDWLKTNEKLLRSKTSYLPTLLYELQIVAIIHGDRPYAISKLEELTELEPFNADYWSILSEEQMNAGNVEAAINAADYALAIDSTNQEAILARARALACSDSADPEELLRLVTPLLKEDSTDSRPLKIAVTAMLQLERTAEAMTLLKRFNDNNPWDRNVIEYLLVLRDPEISLVLDRFFEANTSNNTEEFWREWGAEKYDEGKYKEAAMIFGCYSRHESLSEESIDLFMSAMYLTGFYKGAASHLTNAIETGAEYIHPSIAIIGLMSLIRLGERETAASIVDKLIKDLDNEGSNRRRVTANSYTRDLGYEGQLSTIKYLLSSRDRKMTIESIDPFIGMRDPGIDY